MLVKRQAAFLQGGRNPCRSLAQVYALRGDALDLISMNCWHRAHDRRCIVHDDGLVEKGGRFDSMRLGALSFELDRSASGCGGGNANAGVFTDALLVAVMAMRDLCEWRNLGLLARSRLLCPATGGMIFRLWKSSKKELASLAEQPLFAEFRGVM
ncbi:hypothetical protein GGI07_005357 [Coemansia sp. Benny D115]|nr:hypothetical protein GGI07_005357 [Coemansia sp. Benny D115]